MCYLIVPFKNKDEAKKFGAWWDPDFKMWYIPTYIKKNNKKELLKRFEKFDFVILLNINDSNRDKALLDGAFINKRLGVWCIPPNISDIKKKFLIKEYKNQYCESVVDEPFWDYSDRPFGICKIEFGQSGRK